MHSKSEPCKPYVFTTSNVGSPIAGADGKYLSSEDPFAEVDAPQEKGRLWLWVVVTLGVIASGGLLVRRRIDTLHSRLS